MGEATGIAWTKHTFNPWWGCQRVSPGCEHCYAEAFDKRTGRADWGPKAPRRFFGDKHWDEPLKWNRAAEASGRRALVFCASMADVFEDRRDLDEHRCRLWELIEATPFLTWQLLTKRPENHELVPLRWHLGASPPPNVWLGATGEDRKRFDERARELGSAQWPAVRFLSLEPLLEDLGPIAGRLTRNRIGWVIAGGESGAGRRPFGINWLQRIVAECRLASVPVFVKQDGAFAPGQRGRIPDELWVREMP